jgi:cholesterol transport system auxiliary component
MMRPTRLLLVAVAMMSLAGCLGGKKVPPILNTLTATAPAPASITRSAAAGEAVTITVPVVPKELASQRVPASIGPTAVAYIKDLMWVETPDRLFQHLIQETVTRTTNRVVLDPRQSALDPGLTLSGTLSRFGYDSQEGMVIVRFDGALATAGGTRVETRRFEAREPADGTARTVGPALNTAANSVANDVAKWIGG